MDRLTVEVLGPPLLRQGVTRALAALKSIALVEIEPQVLVVIGVNWPECLIKRRERSGPDWQEPGLAVVTLQEHDLLEGSRLGVCAYLAMGDPAGVLLQGLRAAAFREPFYSPSLAATIRRALQFSVPQAVCALSLTRCEERVATLAAQGLMNAEIADRMSVSVSTVKSHLAAAFRKLQVTHRYQLLDALDRRGLARQSPPKIPITEQGAGPPELLGVPHNGWRNGWEKGGEKDEGERSSAIHPPITH
ncbi:MAG TPA: response regulator transcription factor [Chloroflexota bacterium]|nr:response regulator transcription factor [Chloroflexota bacterium]